MKVTVLTPSLKKGQDYPLALTDELIMHFGGDLLIQILEYGELPGLSVAGLGVEVGTLAALETGADVIELPIVSLQESLRLLYYINLLKKKPFVVRPRFKALSDGAPDKRDYVACYEQVAGFRFVTRSLQNKLITLHSLHPRVKILSFGLPGRQKETEYRRLFCKDEIDLVFDKFWFRNPVEMGFNKPSSRIMEIIEHDPDIIEVNTADINIGSCSRDEKPIETIFDLLEILDFACQSDRRVLVVRDCKEILPKKILQHIGNQIPVYFEVILDIELDTKPLT